MSQFQLTEECELEDCTKNVEDFRKKGVLKSNCAKSQDSSLLVSYLTMHR
jgi:hypothetical protein